MCHCNTHKLISASR